jgi:hypothetical protein
MTGAALALTRLQGLAAAAATAGSPVPVRRYRFLQDSYQFSAPNRLRKQIHSRVFRVEGRD